MQKSQRPCGLIEPSTLGTFLGFPCKPAIYGITTGVEEARREGQPRPCPGAHLGPSALVEQADIYRLAAGRALDLDQRAEFGQFLTPAGVARLMASMFEGRPDEVRILDAGAGVGSLTAAFVEAACRWEPQPRRILATTYEIDPTLAGLLRRILDLCGRECAAAGIEFEADVRETDFIGEAAVMLDGGFFSPRRQTFNCAILNPPYRKIRSESDARRLMRMVGVETSNLYTAFLALVVNLLESDGELVAITPRSFCNGPYFRPFRKLFLDAMALQRVHVFESRDRAFRDDDVLQENIIFRAVKGKARDMVTISASESPEDEYITTREVSAAELVRPGDQDRFIHIVPDDLGQHVAERMHGLPATLDNLDVEVSTGRVVDFRTREFLRPAPGPNAAPLIYPAHFARGLVAWPKQKKGKKPNAIRITRETRELLVPSGTYVLTKRFSTKEERRRVVAAVYDPAHVPADKVAFENHLNVYHRRGRGLPRDLAYGLAVFLNSTLVDLYFRQFNGHTQVNATDLRSLRYPSVEALKAVGARIRHTFPDQDDADRLVEEELLPMSDRKSSNPIHAKRRVEQALAVLKALGLPREQQNERSALTLLALLDLKPTTPWSDAQNPLRGITPMMEFFAEHYGRTYAPNTRETVRRYTVHQFVEAGLVLPNPDDPPRPVNSPKAVYQVTPAALELLKTYGTPEWKQGLATYLTSIETLQLRYARARQMARIPVRVAPDKTITVSPGGQNTLIKLILEEFCGRFTPDGLVLYVGDTGDKFAYFDREGLEAIGVRINEHGKMPDLVVRHVKAGWLVLIEAVTSHGPVSPTRRDVLKQLFKDASLGLVFVTAFLNRRAMVKYLAAISWETEVWVADAPDHLIHFDGERFLGPY